MKEIVLANTELAAQILNSKVKKGFWGNTKFSTEGVYQGRKTRYQWLRDSENTRWNLNASMIPHQIQKPNKFIVLTLPQPTAMTITQGKEVSYPGIMGLVPASYEQKFQKTADGSSAFDKTKSLGIMGFVIGRVFEQKISTKEEIIEIFEELTKASEIVERGAPYYKE